MKDMLILKLFRRTKELAVEFCERCARVCDVGCRRAALRDRALLLTWRYGPRI